MYTRFNHEIVLPQTNFDKVVREYANLTRPPHFLPEITPSFIDSKAGTLRRAGNLLIVSASPDTFTATWAISEMNTASDRAYEDMLEQCGIPVGDSDTLHAYAYSQHLVGGKLTEDDRFAVTSLFDQDAYPFKGKKMSEEKRAKAGEALRSLFTGNMPYPNDFDYKQFMATAKLFGLKRSK